uniref:Uncharacterized protein n=1 Tax=Lutzomyia longipalpis TaxID=7200 RepID=A0A1B0CA62_LUTLO
MGRPSTPQRRHSHGPSIFSAPFAISACIVLLSILPPRAKFFGSTAGREGVVVVLNVGFAFTSTGSTSLVVPWGLFCIIFSLMFLLFFTRCGYFLSTSLIILA